jgi:hypothetical protein
MVLRGQRNGFPRSLISIFLTELDNKSVGNNGQIHDITLIRKLKGKAVPGLD